MMLLPDVRRGLREVGISPDRDLGQNFLVNPSIAKMIAAAVPEGGSVLEIGPGLGALTLPLLERAARVIAIERDAALAGVLQQVRGGRGDLLLTPILALPDQLSAREKDLLEQLRQARSADPRQGWIASARL